MKYLLCIFLLARGAFLLAQCPEEDITFSTQSQIDSFLILYPDCTVMHELITINGEEINNLQGLMNLDTIKYLRISNNPLLVDLNGLSDLNSVTEKLEISSNPNLNSLSGLENLSSVGCLEIIGNDFLTSLTGLENLSSIGKCGFFDFYGGISLGLDISYNNNLESLDGLENLTSVEGSVEILYNAVLTSLAGLENLSSVGLGGSYSDTGFHEWGLTISGNPNLQSLEGLENLASVEGCMVIDNSSLSSIEALANLTSVGECGRSLPFNGTRRNSIVITNTALTSLEGLQNIDSFNYLSLNANPFLSSISDLEFPQRMGGISISNNGGISSLSDLATINYIGGGGLVLSGLDSLTSLNGLESIDSIAGPLVISDNNSLESIGGLEGLSYIKGGHYSTIWSNISTGLLISENPQLTNLEPLQSLNFIDNKVELIDNPTLMVCHSPGICNHLANGGEAIISGNGPGCETKAVVEETCGIVGIQDIKLDKVGVIPNPASDHLILDFYSDLHENPSMNVQIFNINGRILKEIKGFQTNTVVKVADLTKGIYFLRATLKDQVFTARFVKE